MRPPVRFATTVDSGRVAFTTAGNGTPVLDFHITALVNVALEWSAPGVVELYEALASRLQYVRVEPRGLANSGPVPPGRRLEDYVIDDISAVADCLHLETFALMAESPYVAIAAQYASIFPDRISHLIFVNPVMADAPLPAADREGVQRLMRWRADRTGVDIATQEALDCLGPNPSAERVKASAEILRSNYSAKGDACWEATREFRANLDLRPVLPSIRHKTLVISEGPFFGEIAKEVAAAIPGGVLRPDMKRDGEGGAIEFSEVVRAFVDDGERLQQARPAAPSLEITRLSRREQEVLSLLAAGHSNGEIARELVLSVATVTRHVANIFEKLGVHNRVQAAAAFFGALHEGPERGSAALR